MMSTAMALFIANDALVKRVSETWPGPQLIFVRGLFATALMVLVCWSAGMFHRDSHSRTRPVLQLLDRKLLIRAVLDATASTIYLTALFHLPLANATAINMATPLFITMMAVVAFREQVSRVRWIAVALGFAGVWMIVQPAADGFNGWALVCLGATMLHAARDLMTRVIPAQVPSLLVTLSTVTSVTALSGVLTALQGWQVFTPAAHAHLAAASALLCGGYYLLIRCMRAGEMSLIVPFRYTGLLFAIGLGYVLWDEVPNTLAMAGIALLVGAGVFMLSHERWRTRQQALEAAPD
ncbi:MAG: Riboflavin transporter [Pseudomonadota bacterium]